MDCAEAKLHIESYVTGEIAPELKGPLEDHLAACAECRLDGELTRASRNPPSGPSGVPALTESTPIDDAFSEATATHSNGSESVARAEGPAGATTGNASPRGTNESWTLDSIFGAGGQGAGAVGAEGTSDASTPDVFLPEPISASVGPAPGAPRHAEPSHSEMTPADAFTSETASFEEEEPELPDALSGPDLPEYSDEPPPSDAPTWDFEPADVKGDAKPPEGSLFFAEEALSRKGGKSKKSRAMTRALLWTGGAVIGIGLLVVSVWIAMTIRQPLPTSELTTRASVRTGSGSESSNPVASPEGSGPAATETAPMVNGAAAGSTPTNVTPSPPAAVTPTTATSPTPATTATPATPATRAPTSAPPTTTKPPPTETVRASTTKGSLTRTTKSSTTVATRRPSPPPPDDELEAPWMDDIDFTERTAPPRTASGARIVRTPSTHATPTAPKPAETATSTEPTTPVTSGPAVERPIDRLHLATLNAEQNADLVALRKLRETWRGFVKSSIGPDRARAKRELADCLWAIQTLTAKPSDQKEALAAYREYVLNAPAGGADPRTIARMRQLEDATAGH